MGRNSRLLSIARYAWPIFAILGLWVQIASIPTNPGQLYTDWQVINSYPAVKAALPYPAYAVSILGLRYLGALVFWLVAGLVYLEIGRRKTHLAWTGLYTALMLILVPCPLLLNGFNTASRLPQPVVLIGFFIAVLALAMLVLYYFLFPDGSFSPRWMRWIGVAIGIGLLSLFTLLVSEIVQADWLWVASILTLLAGFLLGGSSQVYRYLRKMTPEVRKQTRWVIIALVLQPIILLLLNLFGSSPGSATVALLAAIIIPVLIPLTILDAIVRGKLWGIEISSQKRRSYTYLAGLLTLVWVSGMALVYVNNLRPPAQGVAFEPLPVSEHQREVVIDTDMAPDDWMAILYLLQRPEIRVAAITVAGTGETHCEPGVRNALGLVALAGEAGIPVACGRETPIEGSQAFPDAWRERADNLNGLRVPEGENPYTGDSAVDLLIETVEDAPDGATILTLGPLTNLAEAVQRDPAFSEHIEQIYIMGGALEVLGNVGFSGAGIDNQVAEWNIFVDPQAARMVLESGAPVTLVPLDATNKAPITLDYYFKLAANQRTPEAVFVYDLLSSQLDFIVAGGYYFWDPLAAAILADESLGYIKEGEVKVYTDAGPSSGLTRLMEGGAPTRYARSVDREGFEEDFLQALNQP